MALKLPPMPRGSGSEECCPVRDVLDHIGDRWSVLALIALSNRTHRFTELQRAIGDVSKRMLAQTLRQLERDGFVSRKVHPCVPPKVEYSLTALGTSLVDVIEKLVGWAEEHHEQVRTARKGYRAPVAESAL
jgi:DNA-binding HxlR family transcriptional regulator